MLHDFMNLRKYVGGILNTLGMFKNILGAYQFPKRTGLCYHNNKKIMEN